MLPVSEASARIQRHLLTLPTETVALTDALGRVLRHSIRADRDFPPFDRVAMDGIAIQYAAFANGQRTFPVAGMQRAGQPTQTLTDPLTCIEAMTGAVLPGQTDTVIRYEDVTIDDGRATVKINDIQSGQSVHRQGTDQRAGNELLTPGTYLGPPEIAVAASVGAGQLAVSALPRIALISTGDELVGVADTPLPHQIRQSNTVMLQATLRAMGVPASLHHLPDDEPILNEQLAALLAANDVLILSGGVSAGKADFVPDTLVRLGVERVFHQVAQRPGKPIWFGVVKAADAPTPEKVVFALPGNPVSTALCVQRYVLPWLRASLGLPPEPPRYAQLTQAVTFKPPLTYFLTVRLENTPDGRLVAHPLPGSGSADFANLLAVNAFLELPGTEQDLFGAGDAFRVYGW